MMTCLITVLILALLLGNGFCSVTSLGGLYCTDSTYAVPGTTISITCTTDNPDGISSTLIWTVPEAEVTITSANGADASDGNFVSTVNSFNNTDGTTNATLTFTATSELDGYDVDCESAVTSSTQTCTLYILTLPSAPLNPTCTNATALSVTIEWSLPTDNGGESITNYTVTVTPDDINITTTMTSLLVSDLTNNTNYTFTVRANNTVGYSNYSDTVMCTTLREAVPANAIIPSLLNEEASDTSLQINISSCSSEFLASFDDYTITITGYNPINVDDCQYQQEMITEGDYDITITINNIAGSSEPTTVSFDARWIRDITFDTEQQKLSYSTPTSFHVSNIDDINVTLVITNSSGDVLFETEKPYDTSFDISTANLTFGSYDYTLKISGLFGTPPSYSRSLSVMSSATDPPVTSLDTTTGSTNTPTPTIGTTSTVTTTDDGGPSLIPIIAGVIGGVIILALLIVIILIIGLICYKKRSINKSDKNAPIPLVVQKNIPETGQALYDDPNTIEHVQAPTGDVYALPNQNSKRRPPPTQPVAEIPTYQDPNTIKREQAPTGDIYTLPETKSVYSKVNKNKQDERTMYAELDLSNTPKSPSELPLLQKDVLYSDVRL